MACSALEGIFRRQYALSGGHLAGRILILRTCSACPPPALDCEHQSGLAGGVNCQILPRGGCRTDSRYWRGSRYRTVPDPGLPWPPEGRPAATGGEYPVIPDERSGRRELQPSDFPPARGARVFAENWQAEEIGHGVRERHIRCAHPVFPEGGWRRNIATYAAGRPILRAHDFRVPERRRGFRSCPARNGALSGEKGRRGRRGRRKK